jgi:iron uptake system component EfeO
MPASQAMPKVAVLAVLTALGLTACGGADTNGSAKPGEATQIAVTLSNAGGNDTCALDKTSVPAGPVTFTVTNEDATGITEVELLSGQKILGEKENLAPGLDPVSFTLTLGGGNYEFYCPGASPEKSALKVTGKAAAAPTGSAAQLLAKGATEYGTYVTTQLDAMLVGVKNLQKAVDSGDLAASQKAYADARPFYEKVESDVEGFVMDGFEATDNHGNLDYLIDMRESNLDPAVGWHGFHAVERDLFEGQKITDGTKKYAAELTTNVTKLVKVSKTLTYKPEDLANGAAGLLEEVQSGKISGEEELYSHIDLVDFAANVEGAQQAFAALKPGLDELDANLTKTIAQRFDNVTRLLSTYRDAKELGGYQRYTEELKASDANKLSQSVQALQDALANVAEKVATA